MNRSKAIQFPPFSFLGEWTVSLQLLRSAGPEADDLAPLRCWCPVGDRESRESERIRLGIQVPGRIGRICCDDWAKQASQVIHLAVKIQRIV